MAQPNQVRPERSNRDPGTFGDGRGHLGRFLRRGIGVHATTDALRQGPAHPRELRRRTLRRPERLGQERRHQRGPDAVLSVEPGESPGVSDSDGQPVHDQVHALLLILLLFVLQLEQLLFGLGGLDHDTHEQADECEHGDQQSREPRNEEHL